MLRMASPRMAASDERAVWARISWASGESIWLSTNKARCLTSVRLRAGQHLLDDRQGALRRLRHQAFHAPRARALRRRWARAPRPAWVPWAPARRPRRPSSSATSMCGCELHENFLELKRGGWGWWSVGSAPSRPCMTLNSKLSCAMLADESPRPCARSSRMGANARSTRASCGSPARSAASA